MPIPLQEGQLLEKSDLFSQSDFDRFAELSGDNNPIHVNPGFAARTRFGKTVAHGMMLYSSLCSLLSDFYPGARQLFQEMVFRHPTFAGEEVTIQAIVRGIDQTKNTIELETSIYKADGNKGLDGKSKLWFAGESDFPAEEANYQPNEEGYEQVSFKGLALGQRAEFQRTFPFEMIAEYSDLTGDKNPLVTNNDYAIRAGLPNVMIPGGLLGGIFSYLLGTQLPGRGTNWLKQKLYFPSPAHPGQPLHARVEIVRLRPEKELVNLRTGCWNRNGELVCDGEALVLIKDLVT